VQPRSLLVVLILFSSAQSSLACERSAPAQFQIDPNRQGLDDVPPGKVEAELTELEPGDGPFCVGDSHAILRITKSSDDRTPYDELGFTVRVIDGDAPTSLYQPEYLIRSVDGAITLMWGVGRKTPIPAVDFSVEISATDRAGNQGPASDPIRIHHAQVD